MRTLGFFTSLSPKRISDQQEAINSWVSQGINVFGINWEDEKNLLESHFQNIKIIYLKREKETNRKYSKYIPIEKIFNVIFDFELEYVGILNSDLVLNVSKNDLLNNINKKNVLVAKRMDVDRESGNESVYEFGYDSFIFEKKALLNFNFKNPFLLGVPWWDYWFPLKLKKLGLNLTLDRGNLFIHYLHSSRWDGELWNHFGKKYINELKSLKYNEQIKFGLNNNLELIARVSRQIIEAEHFEKNKVIVFEKTWISKKISNLFKKIFNG